MSAEGLLVRAGDFSLGGRFEIRLKVLLSNLGLLKV